VNKSTVDQIRARFDADVERFSDLEAGQKTAIDSRLCLDLIAAGVAMANPRATHLLDIGCGAGNWSLRMLQAVPGMAVTLVDLSRPMLDRAHQRVSAAGASSVDTVQADVRSCRFDDASFDVIVAGSVLHHLRADDEWREVFSAFHRWLKPGGSVWVYDLLSHESPAIERLMTARYADHLRTLGDHAYVAKVFAYIADEDSPRPITWQTERLREAGFAHVDILHKTAAFGAYVGVRA
jgi:tRNA (cmo5U34)-methyltransferase